MKATELAEVMNKVKVGMTGLEASDAIDQEHFIRRHAFVALSFSLFEVIGGVIVCETSRALDNPYYGWLLFDPAGRDSDPALIAFESASETVVAVARVPLAEARGLVLWRFDHTAGRKVAGKILKLINKALHCLNSRMKGGKSDGGQD